MKRLKREPNGTANAIERFMAERCQVCAICGRPATHGGVYIPNDQKAYGAMPGKVRVFPYGLCDEHSRDPRTPGQVEMMIERKLATAVLLRGTYIDRTGNVEATLYARAAQPGMN